MRIAFSNRIGAWAAVALIAVALAASGCSRPTSAAGPQQPPDVEVVPVEQRDIPIYREWIGTVDGHPSASHGLSAQAGLLGRVFRQKRTTVV